MKFSWNPVRVTRTVLPAERSINFHASQHLLARRKRLQQCFGLLLAAFVGLGSLLFAAD